jgi:hypothetical protein
MMNSTFRSQSVESYVEEIGFEEEDSFPSESSEPSSPKSSVDEDMDDDNLSVKSSRKSRGKGIQWIDYCAGRNDGVLVDYINMEAVQADAIHMDYSKMGSSNVVVLPRPRGGTPATFT